MKKVLFLDNIDGVDLYNVIRNSSRIVAFHGMMTNIGSINKQNILDLSKPCGPAASIAPTIMTLDIAFVTPIKGLCKAGVTDQTT